MTENYQVFITMSVDSANALYDGNFHLYVFKSVASPQSGGTPLVWIATRDFSTKTRVAWQTDYRAYTSESKIEPQSQIIIKYSAAIRPGYILTVDSDEGTGTISSGGEKDSISFLNNTTTPFTCGTSVAQDNTSSPCCAFPLYANVMNVITPVEEILLMFSSQKLKTGTVLERTDAQSILVDLERDTERSVTYNIEEGWSAGGWIWARIIPPNTELAPLLVKSGDTSR